MDKIIWPDKKKFVLCLTHDVDRVKKTYQIITHFLKEKRIYHLTSTFSKQNPYWNFERIMEIEEKLGVRSTFFFLNESKKLKLLKPSTYKLTLGRYNIHDTKIIQIIKKLKDNGWEIGVHGSYESYNNEELLKKEKKELEKIVGESIIGVRQHYLNLNIPRTWEIQRDVGFKYDATFGFRDKIGFRNHIFYPFKPLNDDFLEIPLIVMDNPLFITNKNINDVWYNCKKLIKYAEKKGLVLTILWHQKAFNNKEFPKWDEIYKKMIKECMKHDAWITTCKNVWRFLVDEL